MEATSFRARRPRAALCAACAVAGGVTAIVALCATPVTLHAAAVLLEDDTRGLDSLFRAQLAESAERMDDMADAMREFVQRRGSSIEPAEQGVSDMFARAYEAACGGRRAKVRAVKAAGARESDATLREVASSYLAKLVGEMEKYCGDAIRLIDTFLVPASAASGEPHPSVYWYTLKGNYYRYLAEIGEGDAAAHSSEAAYRAAHHIAVSSLGAADPLRLGAAHSYFILLIEEGGRRDEALGVAGGALRAAKQAIEASGRAQPAGSQQLLRALRDDIERWQR